jgi:hypothetical protein
VKIDLNPEVPGSFVVENPLETLLATPLPGPFPLASPNGSRFSPVDLYTGCTAEGLEDFLRPVHVGWGAFQIQSSVVSEGLIPDQTSSG